MVNCLNFMIKGSWEQAIKNRLKNRRKAKPAFKAAKRQCALPSCDTLKPKKLKKIFDLGKVPEKPAGETLETCQEHALVLRKEMSKTTNKNMCMIKQLMTVTYPFRREHILKEPAAVHDILKGYPALNLVSEVVIYYILLI